MKQLRGDNRGLSLIEVLVAVVILAIVVTPFLHSFVTAATTNSKAKSIHKATVIAQSVMEGFKAESLEEIAMQFNYPAQGFYVLAPGRIESGTRVESLVGELRYDSGTGIYSDTINYENPVLSGVLDKKAGVTASTYSEDMGVTGEFLGQTDGIYYFSMEEVKEDSTTYDVLVKVDATAYRSGSELDAIHQYNGDELVQLPVIDLEQDAMSIQKEDYTDLAVDKFCASHSGVTENEIREGLGRCITVSVDRTRVGTEYRTTVTAEYKYTYRNLGEVWEDKRKQTCYDSMETETELRSVYLYYYPLYTTDEIIFENNEMLPVNFYLMKQAGSRTTMTNEEQYDLQLSLLEPEATETTMQTKVYTNLATNLSNGEEIVSPAYTVMLNGSIIDRNSIASKDILVTEKGDRIFDIEVSVYKLGAKSAGYPEDMRLTTLEGSKIN